MSELEEKKVQAHHPASAAKPAATRPAAPSAVAAPAAPPPFYTILNNSPFKISSYYYPK